MNITVVGLNHKTAAIDLREKLAFNAEQVEQMLTLLKDRFPQGEFVLLSTCNRTELYHAAEEAVISGEDLTDFIAQFCDVPLAEFRDSLYIQHDADAVRHLLNVAASLDSLVVGEAQIIAQVKESYHIATAANSAGKILNRLFHCAFATSKEVYSSTSIAQRRVSVAGVAIELAQQLLENIASARTAIIGAGEMAGLLVRHLLDLNCQNITVFNRTLSRAQEMGRNFSINSGSWTDLKAFVQNVDIIVAAAASDDYLFDKSFVSAKRTGPLLIIDIAVPRNFHPDAAKLEDVYLYSVDDLAQVVQENLQARQEDIGQAREIIADNVVSFMDWFGTMDIGPLIGELRQTCQQVSRSELDRFLAGEKNMPTVQRQKIEAAANRIVNKLVHRFINSLHTIAKTHGPEEAARLIESMARHQDRPTGGDAKKE